VIAKIAQGSPTPVNTDRGAEMARQTALSDAVSKALGV
jgi:hypothetical protein